MTVFRRTKQLKENTILTFNTNLKLEVLKYLGFSAQTIHQILLHCLFPNIEMNLKERKRLNDSVVVVVVVEQVKEKI